MDYINSMINETIAICSDSQLDELRRLTENEQRKRGQNVAKRVIDIALETFRAMDVTLCPHRFEDNTDEDTFFEIDEYNADTSHVEVYVKCTKCKQRTVRTYELKSVQPWKEDD